MVNQTDLREKVLHGIDACSRFKSSVIGMCDNCPYRQTSRGECLTQLLLDAKKLIEGETSND